MFIKYSVHHIISDCYCTGFQDVINSIIVKVAHMQKYTFYGMYMQYMQHAQNTKWSHTEANKLCSERNILLFVLQIQNQ